MKISVIIPVYNGEKYIGQCIENVLCQTYKNIEIIVVNDGSKDRSGEIAASYPGVKVIDQPNSGPSVSRNRGIREATGDYIHFMDADDLIDVDFYSNLIAAAERADADMAFCSYRDEAKPDLSLVFDKEMVLTALEDKVHVTRSGLFGYPWRYIIRRRFWIESGLEFPAGRIIEDLQVTLGALCAAGRVVTVPAATYWYKKRDGSLLNSRLKPISQQRSADLRVAKQLRAKFFSDNGLGGFIHPIARHEYKLFGAIPVAAKIELNNGKTKWYLFGLLVMQKKCVKA